MVVRLEAWIVAVTRLSFYKAPSTLELIHVSKAIMRKCRVPQEVYMTTAAELKCGCGKRFYWLLFTPKSAPKHRWAFITVWWEAWEWALWIDQGCPRAECFGLFLLSPPQRPKQPSHQSNCPLTAHLSDIVGTPSVTRFCHNNVWMCVCVAVCLSGFQSVLLAASFLWTFLAFLLWFK